jgi:hypothetical protein
MISAAQKMKCGKCLTEWFVYSDIQTKGTMCPTCNQVQGILWKGLDEADHLYYGGTVPPHLDGEDQYDYDWLKYDSKESDNDEA